MIDLCMHGISNEKKRITFMCIFIYLSVYLMFDLKIFHLILIYVVKNPQLNCEFYDFVCLMKQMNSYKAIILCVLQWVKLQRR